MDKKQAWTALVKQLAADYHARPEDFQTPGVTLTLPARLPGPGAPVRHIGGAAIKGIWAKLVIDGAQPVTI